MPIAARHCARAIVNDMLARIALSRMASRARRRNAYLVGMRWRQRSMAAAKKRKISRRRDMRGGMAAWRATARREKKAAMARRKLKAAASAAWHRRGIMA